MMSLAKKIRYALIELEVSQSELAKRTNQSQPNLSKKIIADNFNFNEYEKLVHALGCKLEVNIILPDGKIL